MTIARIDAGAAALADPERFRLEVVEPGRPVLLPGAAAGWPLLAGGRAGVVEHLRRHDAGRPAEMFVGPPAIAARYHYDDALTGFNFERRTLPFADGLARILADHDEDDGGVGDRDRQGGADRPSLYMGSLTAETYLPGIEALTALPFVPASVRPRFWIGHASRVACHYDTMDNVAVVAVGRRRFTLYPPDAIGDLYVGPIDHTLAGQPIALAVGSDPGDRRFPRFDRARDRAIVVELAPGDALYLPKLWWHQVEALDRVNILVNFWWDGAVTGPDQPYHTMLLAMLAIADRPPAERAAWRAWFDHYVFRPEGHPLRHLSPERHGVLGADPGIRARLRATVMRMLRGG